MDCFEFQNTLNSLGVQTCLKYSISMLIFFFEKDPKKIGLAFPTW